MGQDGGAEGSGPSRHVNIPWSFWLSKYEITIAQYAEYLNIALVTGKVIRNGATNVISKEAIFQGAPIQALLLELGTMNVRWNVNKFEAAPGTERFPASVTWYGAVAFSLFYSYDLPTTAEWEKAARGPENEDANTHLKYPWGDYITGQQLANYSSSRDSWETGLHGKTPVGYYNGKQVPTGPDNPNAYGLYDVIGNVSEWTRSIASPVENYSQEESLPAYDNVLGDSSSKRVLRGGSNQSPADLQLSIFARKESYPALENSSAATGFRLIRRSLP